MRYNLFFALFLLCLMLCACGGESSPSHSATTDLSTNEATEAPAPGLRGSTPVVYLGAADGTETYGNASVTIDTSHKDQGYIMVHYTGDNQKPKFQLTGPNDITYTYNLHGEYETFPLTAGDGTYQLSVWENIEGTSYSSLFSQSIDVSLINEFLPFLYANQYVNYSATSKTAEKACELAYTANTDLEVVEQVYNYIISNFTYDYDKAKTVPKGYLPVVDEVFAQNTGICFDYASVMATMLRTQNIPTRLEVGYMQEEYHAWISIYIKEQGWINGIIEFDGVKWELMDPTFASGSKKPKDFIMETDKYITKYVY